VSAVVPAPLPPEVPVITNENATTVGSSTVEVTGTCYIIVPALIVVLIRNGQTIGSGVCSLNGTFQITVPLVLGVNIINVKFMTITGDSGGFGSPLTIYYSPKKEPTKPTNSKPLVAKPSLGQLSIDLHYDFLTYSTDTEMSVTVGIDGGKPPYKVFIGWGDNSSRVMKMDGPDSFIIKHLYRSIPSNQMIFIVRVFDSAGSETSAERALISFRKPQVDAASQPVERERSKIIPITIWIILTSLVCLLIVIWYAKFLPESAKKTSQTRSKQAAAKKRTTRKRR